MAATDVITNPLSAPDSFVHSKPRERWTEDERRLADAWQFEPSEGRERGRLVAGRFPELAAGLPVHARPDHEYERQRAAAIELRGLVVDDPEREREIRDAATTLLALRPPDVEADDLHRERFGEAFGAADFGALVKAWMAWLRDVRLRDKHASTEHGLRVRLGLARPDRPPWRRSGSFAATFLDELGRAAASSIRDADDAKKPRR
jgi:hypothetical protein